jgi:hypothetical protein
LANPARQDSTQRRPETEDEDGQGGPTLVVIRTTTSVKARNRLRIFAAAEASKVSEMPGNEGSNSPTGLHDHGRPSDVDSTRKGASMDPRYEYKFVRLGEYAGSALFGVSDKARNAYEDLVHEHARDGWRLVQIFAPGVAAFGAAKYYELIFERERAEDTNARNGADRERVASTARA